MQDIHHHQHHSMVGIGGGGDGGARRFFGGGDRRVSSHQHHHHHHQAALKCPRCNSLNTKFCYYNNYNLSQPRHFCKSCRRYWTKGGVLRNVPVGGGCRKTKRSKPNKPSSSVAAAAEKSPPSAVDGDGEGKSSASHSSSESSYLTASAGVPPEYSPAEAAAAEVASVPIASFGVNNPRLYGNGIEWSALLGQGSSDGGIFTEMGSFTSLMSNETTPFGYGGETVNLSEQCLDQLKVEGETVNRQFDDRTVGIEFPGRSSVGFEPLDWGGAGAGGDEVLYDLTSTVDHAYWSQSQWTTDQDHHGLYLP